MRDAFRVRCSRFPLACVCCNNLEISLNRVDSNCVLRSVSNVAGMPKNEIRLSTWAYRTKANVNSKTTEPSVTAELYEKTTCRRSVGRSPSADRLCVVITQCLLSVLANAIVHRQARAYLTQFPESELKQANSSLMPPVIA